MKSNSPAITSKNLVNKICFIVFGGGLDKFSGDLKAAFRGHLSRGSEKIVTRQAVDGWADQKSSPTRLNAYRFLSDFLESRTEVFELGGDRKKVLKQCKGFLSREIRRRISEAKKSTEKTPVKFSSKHGLLIQKSFTSSVADEFCKSWLGYYESYRFRLIKNKLKPIAKELVRIYRFEAEIKYHHWHLKDGHIPQRFEGNCLLKKGTVWMIGASADGERLRICHFKNDSTENKIFRRFRWGIMHSDMPSPASIEPASTRIFFNRLELNSKNVESHVERNVRYMNFPDVEPGLREFVERAVRNDVSSQSQPNTWSPIEDSDHALRVDYNTLAAMCEQAEDV